jgi:hypothetical protein
MNQRMKGVMMSKSSTVEVHKRYLALHATLFGNVFKCIQLFVPDKCAAVPNALAHLEVALDGLKSPS